jgi:hypothetical protein
MQIPLTAFGLALVAGAPVANAQTVITRQIADQPVETVIAQRPSGTLVAQEPLVTVPSGTLTQPVQTVQTVETVRTVRPVAHVVPRHVVPRHVVHHQVVTTRTIRTTRRIAPMSGTVVARTAGYPQPLYDEVAPPPPVEAAPVYGRPVYDQVAPPPLAAYPRPLYDAVIPAADTTVAPDVAAPVIGPSGIAVPFYRYVYEPDRILVIDPNTNVAVQAIPR